ncbi:MAG: DUF1987 domain-containing protein [Cyclobacteriaceae bacterium]
MTTIAVSPTPRTPAIYCNLTRGVLDIKGRSSPENTPAFYSPIKEAITSDATLEKLNVRILLEYFNTSSSKCLYDIFKALRLKQRNGTEINVKWYYEEYDEDMLEAGEDYSDILNLPFTFVEY